MKYFFIILLSSIVIMLSVACIYNSVYDSTETRTPNYSATHISSETSYVISASRDAEQFRTESDMINRLKAGSVKNDDNNIEKINYYYRLKKLPEGSKLIRIRLKAFYLAFDYVTDDQDANQATNLITFVWYRTFFGEDLMKSAIRSGLPWEPMLKNEAYSFYTSENIARNKSGELDESLPRVELCKVVEWTQDGCCFQVNAPLWFTEDDALEYCIAEKALID